MRFFQLTILAVTTGAVTSLIAIPHMSRLMRSLIVLVLFVTLVAGIPDFIAALTYLYGLIPDGAQFNWQIPLTSAGKIRLALGLCVFAVGIYAAISALLIILRRSSDENARLAPAFAEDRYEWRELWKAMGFAFVGIFGGLLLMELPGVEYVFYGFNAVFALIPGIYPNFAVDVVLLVIVIILVGGIQAGRRAN